MLDAVEVKERPAIPKGKGQLRAWQEGLMSALQ